MKIPMRERIGRSVEIDENGCWIWALHVDRRGYGRIMVDGKPTGAHRASHVAFIGPIPDGYDVDHLCYVTACCNPEHLEAVPPIVNRVHRRRPRANGKSGALRDWSGGECKRGHALTADNVYVAPSGKRQCRSCQRAAVAAYAAKKREATV